jgi:hypothetical protein
VTEIAALLQEFIPKGPFELKMPAFLQAFAHK